MDAQTGSAQDRLANIRQSIQKILSTPVGTRIMRREFGSLLPDLVDAPINERTRLLVMSATATAVIRWEPRIIPTAIGLELADNGGQQSALIVELTATLRDGPEAGQSVSFELEVPR
jgi:phage baseplate assembly protein W